jgi:hypothetical protein
MVGGDSVSFISQAQGARSCYQGMFRINDAHGKKVWSQNFLCTLSGFNKSQNFSRKFKDDDCRVLLCAPQQNFFAA